MIMIMMIMVRGDVATAAEKYFKRCELLRTPTFGEDTAPDHPLNLQEVIVIVVVPGCECEGSPPSI